MSGYATMLLRPLMFLVISLCLGLIPLWVTALALVFKEKPVSVELLLSNGGVFFFSTSITCNGLFLIMQKGVLCKTEIPTIISVFALIFVVVPSLVAYGLGASEPISQHLTFSTAPYLRAQIAVALLSVLYALFANGITGTFK